MILFSIKLTMTIEIIHSNTQLFIEQKDDRTIISLAYITHTQLTSWHCYVYVPNVTLLFPRYLPPPYIRLRKMG